MPLFTSRDQFTAGCTRVLQLLDAHYNAFAIAKPFADATLHTVPCDTKSWSQILVSLLTGLRGRGRGKGSDLEDGSDVKAASVWEAIDTPRFNGCLPAGRTTEAARKPNNVTALDDEPFLFFVLWDKKPPEQYPRCRVWVVRTQEDPEFRAMATRWYAQRETGQIRSDNFQLHPPRNLNSDVFRNNCGNLSYPLLFSALSKNGRFEVEHFEPAVLDVGACSRA